MKRRTLLVITLAVLMSFGWAKTLTLLTRYGPNAANADRVMVSGEDGRWREAAGAGGTYRVELEGSRFSLAITCFSPQGPEITVYRFLTEELDDLRHVCPGGGDLLAGATNVSGRLFTGPQATTREYAATVRYGSHLLYSGTVRDGATFAASPGAETADLLALYGPQDEAPTTADLRREYLLPDDAQLVLDFAAGGVAPLERHTLAASDTHPVTLSARLVTCSGLSADVGASAATAAATLAYAALSGGASQGCDRYELTVSAVSADGRTLRLAAANLAVPGDLQLELPAPVGSPALETVGTDPLRARLSWQSEPGVLLYVGSLTDGRVRWSFVQSAWLAPSITLPPWGADVGAPDIRGGAFAWTFGAVRSAGALHEVLHAYAQHSVTGQQQFWYSVSGGLRHQVSLTGGRWAPHAPESTGGR